MPDDPFDVDAWLTRIRYGGSRAPNLETLRALIAAHSSAIAYESIDVLWHRPPKLDIASLQKKMIAGGRGGYCFEQNMLFRGGLQSLGYKVTSLQARVVRGLEIDAPRPCYTWCCVSTFPRVRFWPMWGSETWRPRRRSALNRRPTGYASRGDALHRDGR